MLRDAGLHKVIVDLGWSVEETGDLQFAAPSHSDPVIDRRYGKAKQSFSGERALQTLQCPHHANPC
jgi:hypothetical protein